MPLAETPLARWMERHGYSVASLARELGESRMRIQHYVHRRAFPAGPLLIRLIAMTGLEARDFLPESQMPPDLQTPRQSRKRRAA